MIKRAQIGDAFLQISQHLRNPRNPQKSSETSRENLIQMEFFISYFSTLIPVTIEYLPRHLHKFDFSLRARVRNGNKSEIRIGGAVEPPILSIDQSAFDLSGVPCGLESQREFSLANPQSTKTLAVFEFQTEEFFVRDENGMGSPFEILPKSSKKLWLCFRPLSVTSFDFSLPIIMNEVTKTKYYYLKVNAKISLF